MLDYAVKISENWSLLTDADKTKYFKLSLNDKVRYQDEMQQLTDNSRSDALCNAILKGIVEGATEKDGITGNTLSILLGQPGGKTCR